MDALPLYHMHQLKLEDRPGDFELIDVAQSFLHARQDVFGAHRHDFFEAFFLQAVSGKVNIDFSSFTLDGPLVMLILPGQVHRWDLGPLPSGWVLRFSQEWLGGDAAFDTTLVGHFLPSLVQLSPEQDQVFLSVTSLMHREFQADLPRRTEGLSALLRLWLLEFYRLVNATGQWELSPPRPLSRRFLDLIDHQFGSHPSVRDLAGELGTSTTRLFNEVRADLGQTPGELVRNRLLLEAKRLLSLSERNVSEIAWELGFEDPSYFTRFFRKAMRCTPLEFRNQAEKAIE